MVILQMLTMYKILYFCREDNLIQVAKQEAKNTQNNSRKILNNLNYHLKDLTKLCLIEHGINHLIVLWIL